MLSALVEIVSDISFRSFRREERSICRPSSISTDFSAQVLQNIGHRQEGKKTGPARRAGEIAAEDGKISRKGPRATHPHTSEEISSEEFIFKRGKRNNHQRSIIRIQKETKNGRREVRDAVAKWQVNEPIDRSRSYES
jgi:hypothetical protein